MASCSLGGIARSMAARPSSEQPQSSDSAYSLAIVCGLAPQMCSSSATRTPVRSLPCVQCTMTGCALDSAQSRIACGVTRAHEAPRWNVLGPGARGTVKGAMCKRTCARRARWLPAAAVCCSPGAGSRRGA
eukprot:5533587-Prymnesium_polylepis.2